MGLQNEVRHKAEFWTKLNVSEIGKLPSVFKIYKLGHNAIYGGKSSFYCWYTMVHLDN